MVSCPISLAAAPSSSCVECGIHHITHQSAVVKPLLRRRRLQHQKGVEIQGGIDPAIGAADATPKIVAPRSGKRCDARIEPNGETQSESIAWSRRVIAGAADVAAKMIGCHVSNRR